MRRHPVAVARGREHLGVEQLQARPAGGGRGGGVAVGEPGRALGGEAGGVQRVDGVGDERVARRAARHGRRVAQRPAQLRHLDLQRVRPGRRRARGLRPAAAPAPDARPPARAAPAVPWCARSAPRPPPRRAGRPPARAPPRSARRARARSPLRCTSGRGRRASSSADRQRPGRRSSAWTTSCSAASSPVTTRPCSSRSRSPPRTGRWNGPPRWPWTPAPAAPSRWRSPTSRATPDRALLLARDHLADHPADLLVAHVAARLEGALP